MQSPTGRILKSSDVKLEGQFRLDTGREVPNSANEKNAALSPAGVRIVENHPEFAVMEVTCRCGDKTHIRCEYAPAHSTEQKPNHQNDGENDNAS